MDDFSFNVEGLCVGYDTTTGHVEVLLDLTLTAKQGEIVGIVGPSGCGKTTLLRLLAGVADIRGVVQAAGTVRVFDQEPHMLRQTGAVGLVAQRPVLLPWRSVLENALLPFEIRKAVNQEVRDRAAALLHDFELSEFLHHSPAELSAGMQQRLALARALLSSPRLLLLDEPVSSTDELLRENLLRRIESAWLKYKPTVVFVSHDLDDSILLCDRVVILSARPANVAGTVNVNMARPRTFLKADPGFLRALEEVKAIVRGAGGR